MSFTVKATGSPGGNADCYLLIKVLTGATEAGGQSASLHNATGTAPNASITPAGTHSLILWNATADASSAWTLEANNTEYGTLDGDTDGWDGGFHFYSGTVTGGTPVTIGLSSTGTSDDTTLCGYEVLSSGGSTPAVDASSPAHVTAATACTTAAFTPPAGSVLVAMFNVSSTGSTNATGTISDTSGLGLTWTQRGLLTGPQAQVALIWTTTIPAGGATVPQGAQQLRIPPRPFPPLSRKFGPAAPFMVWPGGTPAVAVTTQVATATIAGAAAVAALVVQDAGLSTSLAGAGGVNASGVITGTASLAGAATVTSVVTQPGGGGMAGAGGVSVLATQAVTATAAGAGAVTTSSVQAVTATSAGAGSVAAVVTEAVIAAAAGAGAVNASAAGNVVATATLTGAATVTALATQIAPATTTGLGSVTAKTVQATFASPAGAAAVSAHVVQAVISAAAAASSLTATATVASGGGPGTVQISDTATAAAMVGDRLAETVTITDQPVGTITISDRLADNVSIADQATGTVTIGDQLP